MQKRSKLTLFKKWLSKAKGGRIFYKEYKVYVSKDGTVKLVAPMRNTEATVGWNVSDRTRQQAGKDKEDKTTFHDIHYDSFAINRGIHVHVWDKRIPGADKTYHINHCRKYVLVVPDLVGGHMISSVYIPVRAYYSDYVAHRSHEGPTIWFGGGEAVFMKIKIGQKDWDDLVEFAKRKVKNHKRRQRKLEYSST